MSGVQRITVLWPVGPVGYGNQEAVLASDYDAARSELAALREELAKSGRADHLRQRIAFLTTEIHKQAKRLSAAEQRNSALMDLLAEHQWQWKPYDEHYHIDAGYYCIQCGNAKDSGHAPECAVHAALTQPTESGASGLTCNQIREESGLPINNPCIACNNGACIDK
jgi:hypothetical protein